MLDIEVQNRALLNKWIFRFSEEQESKWKWVLCAKYNMDAKVLFPNNNTRLSPSMIWKGITDQLREGGKFYSIFNENIGLLQGNGESILFWEDKWLNGARLKEKFPRIYALLVVKNAPILSFGSWADDTWFWKITLRRDIFY